MQPMDIKPMLFCTIAILCIFETESAIWQNNSCGSLAVLDPVFVNRPIALEFIPREYNNGSTVQWTRDSGGAVGRFWAWTGLASPEKLDNHVLHNATDRSVFHLTILGSNSMKQQHVHVTFYKDGDTETCESPTIRFTRHSLPKTGCGEIFMRRPLREDFLELWYIPSVAALKSGGSGTFAHSWVKWNSSCSLQFCNVTSEYEETWLPNSNDTVFRLPLPDASSITGQYAVLCSTGSRHQSLTKWFPVFLSVDGYAVNNEQSTLSSLTSLHGSNQRRSTTRNTDTHKTTPTTLNNHGDEVSSIVTTIATPVNKDAKNQRTSEKSHGSKRVDANKLDNPTISTTVEINNNHITKITSTQANMTEQYKAPNAKWDATTEPVVGGLGGNSGCNEERGKTCSGERVGRKYPWTIVVGVITVAAAIMATLAVIVILRKRRIKSSKACVRYIALWNDPRSASDKGTEECNNSAQLLPNGVIIQTSHENSDHLGLHQNSMDISSGIRS